MKDKIVEILKEKLVVSGEYDVSKGVINVGIVGYEYAAEKIAHLYSAGEEVRNIVSDAMDALALEFAMTGRRDIDVADHVDALTKKLSRPTDSAGEEVKQIKGFVEFNLSESAKEENWESELFAKGWIAALMHVKVNCLDKLPLPYPTVSEEEIDEVIHAVYNIYVLQERITFYYANRPTLVDEISKLQTRQRKAIKELLNR